MCGLRTFQSRPTRGRVSQWPTSVFVIYKIVYCSSMLDARSQWQQPSMATKMKRERFLFLDESTHTTCYLLLLRSMILIIRLEVNKNVIYIGAAIEQRQQQQQRQCHTNTHCHTYRSTPISCNEWKSNEEKYVVAAHNWLYRVDCRWHTLLTFARF